MHGLPLCVKGSRPGRTQVRPRLLAAVGSVLTLASDAAVSIASIHCWVGVRPVSLGIGDHERTTSERAPRLGATRAGGAAITSCSPSSQPSACARDGSARCTTTSSRSRRRRRRLGLGGRADAHVEPRLRRRLLRGRRRRAPGAAAEAARARAAVARPSATARARARRPSGRGARARGGACWFMERRRRRAARRAARPPRAPPRELEPPLALLLDDRLGASPAAAAGRTARASPPAARLAAAVAPPPPRARPRAPAARRRPHVGRRRRLQRERVALQFRGELVLALGLRASAHNGASCAARRGARPSTSCAAGRARRAPPAVVLGLPTLGRRAPAVQICSQALDVEQRLMEGGSAHWVYHRNVDAGDGHGV